MDKEINDLIAAYERHKNSENKWSKIASELSGNHSRVYWRQKFERYQRKVNQNTLNAIKSTLECTVCSYLLIIPVIILSCGHRTCSYCMNNWSRVHNNCPMCRAFVSGTQNDFLSASIIESLEQSMTQTERNERISIRNDRLVAPNVLKTFHFLIKYQF